MIYSFLKHEFILIHQDNIQLLWLEKLAPSKCVWCYLFGMEAIFGVTVDSQALCNYSEQTLPQGEPPPGPRVCPPTPSHCQGLRFEGSWWHPPLSFRVTLGKWLESCVLQSSPSYLCLGVQGQNEMLPMTQVSGKTQAYGLSCYTSFTVPHGNKTYTLSPLFFIKPSDSEGKGEKQRLLSGGQLWPGYFCLSFPRTSSGRTHFPETRDCWLSPSTLQRAGSCPRGRVSLDR